MKTKVLIIVTTEDDEGYCHENLYLFEGRDETDSIYQAAYEYLGLWSDYEKKHGKIREIVARDITNVPVYAFMGG